MALTGRTPATDVQAAPDTGVDEKTITERLAYRVYSLEEDAVQTDSSLGDLEKRIRALEQMAGIRLPKAEDGQGALPL